MYYDYILYSTELDHYYIGCSQNPEERLKKHLFNHRGFTAKAKDWSICLTEAFEIKTDSLKRERQLKNWKNKTRLRQLIEKSKDLSSDD